MRDSEAGSESRANHVLTFDDFGTRIDGESLDPRDVASWLKTTRHLVDDWIQQDIDAMDAQPGSVEEAMAYALQAGGKRIRPQLMMAAADYVGLTWDRIRPAVLAIEYLHTYSLIHDDLPAMDDDALRRGRPTAHKVFGEAMAILAGDALLTEAFNQMARLTEQGFPSRSVVAAIERLARAAGRSGLVRGQVEDLAAENKTVGLEELEEIQRMKTGALFKTALAIPPMLVEDEHTAQALTSFGEHFGLVFQMVDDILNVIGDPKLLGKATGTDASRGKATYPRLMTIEQVKKLIDTHVESAKSELDGSDSTILEGLIDFARDRSW